MKDIYKYSNYKDYIRHELTLNKSVRGYQGRLSEAAGCQKSYFSQMLSTHIHLTPEHAFGLTTFWNFAEEEARYFQDMVQFERTSHRRLKALIEARLKEAREKQAEPSRRYGGTLPLDEESRQAYYSSWQYAAVHVLAGTQTFKTASAISDRLSLPLELVSRVLEQLREMGLISQKEGKWKNEARHIHIPKESYMNSVNHNQWRQRAVLDSQQNREGLHYTSVYSHRREDFQKIRDRMMSAIEDSRQIIKPSDPEDVSVLCLDFFWA